jgi:hypothetical protein
MPVMRARGAETFAATPPAPGAEPTLSARRDEQTFVGLGTLIASFGRSWSVIGGGERDTVRGAVHTALGESMGGQGRPAPLRADRSFPTGVRTDVAATAALARARLADTDLTIVDFADVARVESRLGRNPALRAPWIALSMRRADRLLGDLLHALRPADTLVVLSPTPSVRRQSDQTRLGAVAILGPRYRRALLTSDTMHRAGFVSLIDMAPTVLSLLRLPPQEDFLSGHAIRTARTADNPGAAARALESDLIEAARAHGPLTRAVLIWGFLVGALALLTVLAGRGRPAGAGRFPDGWRDWLFTLAIQAMLAPVVASLFTIFGSKGPTGSIVFAFVASFVVATGARTVLGRQRAAVAALSVTFVFPLLDVLAGSPLSARSALVSPLAEGRTIDGVDAATIGIVFAGAIFVIGLTLDRWDLPSSNIAWSIAPPVLLLGVAVVVLGGMSFLPLTLAAAPAAGLLAARTSGRHASARALLAVACGIVFVLGVLSLDYEREGGDPISVIVTGHLSPVARAHADAAEHVFGFTIWVFALVALAVPLVVLWWRRRALLDRALWGRTHHRAALAAAAATAAASQLAIEGGLITTVYLMLYASTTTFLPLLAPDD